MTGPVMDENVGFQKLALNFLNWTKTSKLDEPDRFMQLTDFFCLILNYEKKKK